MSLDFYLMQTNKTACPNCSHELTTEGEEVFSINITHNLGQMADKAGIYKCLWRPEENGFEYAEQLIKPLEKGLAKLKKKPEYFEQFNASNGWGMYKHFVPFVEQCLEACRNNPEAKVRASR